MLDHRQNLQLPPDNFMNEEKPFSLILGIILTLMAVVLMIALRQVAVRLIVTPIMYFLWLLD